MIVINPLPTSDRIDVCRLLSSSRSEHGQFTEFFRSRPGIAEVLRAPNGRVIVLLEPGFNNREDWILATTFSNPTGDPDDGAYHTQVLAGNCGTPNEKETVPARRLSHSQSGGYVVHVDVCERLSTQDGTVSSAHCSRPEIAEFLRPAYNRAVLILNSQFDNGKDWVIAGMSQGYPGGRRDMLGFRLAGALPKDAGSATEALQTIKKYLKLCATASGLGSGKDSTRNTPCQIAD